MSEIKVRPGWLVGNICTARGGITYDREKVKTESHGEGYSEESLTTKNVDNQRIVTLVNNVVAAGNNAIKACCVRTMFGWYATDDGLEKLREKLAEIKIAADAANEEAERAGSARRAHIGIVPARIDVTSAEAAAEIAHSVREILIEMVAALRAGDSSQHHNVMLRADRLDTLAVGPAADTIAMALENSKTARKVLLKAIRDGADPATAGGGLDLGMLEAAVDWFDPALQVVQGGTSTTENADESAA